MLGFDLLISIGEAKAVLESPTEAQLEATVEPESFPCR